MTRSFLIVIFVAALGNLLAQGPAIALQEICWTTPESVDSNITAYWLMSSRDSVPRLINYLNAQGQTVVVSAGGDFRNGYCCCTTGGGGDTYRTVASRTDSLLGLTTYTVGFIDTVGLDIASLTESAPKGNGYLVFYDETANTNYKILLSSLMEEPYPGYTSCECDTIYQVAHGFQVGDIVGQVRGNGPFFTANTSDPDSLPVAYVHEVLHADTFVIKSEGWLMDWTHGLPLGRDYFVQDDGSLDTIPDTGYSVFAFRTVNTTKAYFDIPELVVDQSGDGGGGGGADADWYESGATPPDNINDDIYTYGRVGINTATPTYSLDILNDSTNPLRWRNTAGVDLISWNKGTASANARQWFRTNVGNLVIQIHPTATTYFDSITIFRIGPDHSPGLVYPVENQLFASTIANWFYGKIYDRDKDLGSLASVAGADASGNLDWKIAAIYEDAGGYLIANTAEIPDYASDAAADADGSLPTGAIYRVTAEDRNIRIKP